MIITYSTYIELPVPMEAVQSALARPDRWATLPTGAERAGELWRWGSELYRVALRDTSDGIAIEAAPIAGRAGRIHVAISLRDAVISTHATVTIILDAPLWPWQRAGVRHALAQRTRLCIEVLRRELERGADVLQRRKDAEALASDDLAETLRARYPHTVAAFESMNALDHLQRVQRLEEGWQRIAVGTFDASVYSDQTSPRSSIRHQASETSFDLIYAGGGLGLLHAAVMAHKGWRVLLFDRGEVGCAHREWNISKAELSALVALELVTWDELQPIVMREYRTGVVRFHSGPNAVGDHNDLWLPGVLDVALDAGALLQLMRRKLEGLGGTVLDGRGFKRVVVNTIFNTKTQRRKDAKDVLIEVELEALATGARELYSGRLLLDGMGSTSPLALLRHQGHPFAAVCPTVGTVATGFVPGADDPRHHDPTSGDILITVTDAQHDQQYMWEGFPGRDDELTVYLFYYDMTDDERRKTKDEGHTPQFGVHPSSFIRHPSKSHSLLALFEAYFALLPTYKAPGPEFRHLKPVYGYIPARHSLRRQEARLLRGVLPVGDSAAQQSPLTFCGFGSHVRNLRRTTGLLDYALRHELTEPEDLQHISAFQANVSLNWVFSRFMHPWGQPHVVNQLQNIFLGVLNDLGGDLATRFFQDRMRWSDYHKMVLGMFRRYPPIVGIAWRVLGFAGCQQWIGDYLRFSREALWAGLGRTLTTIGERMLYRLLDTLSPRLCLALRARYAEWRAMGWIR